MLQREAADRLAKLIPLLASDKDGEVVATARAISRTLKAAGSDFHALADAMARGRPGRSFNYADTFREASPVSGGHAHPDACSPKFGLQIDGSGMIAPWREVALQCLDLNKQTPKRQGGRFLRDFEVTLLTNIRDGKIWPTNTQVAWIETVVARCHQARDAARRAASGA